MENGAGFRPQVLQQGIVAGDAQEAQSDDQQARYRAAPECDRQRIVDPPVGGFGSAQVGAHGDVHADVTGGAGEQRADQEPEAGVPVEHETQHDEQDDTDRADGRVLAVEIRGGSLLDGRSDFPHAFVAFGLGEYPAHREDAVEDGDYTANQGEVQC